LCNTYFKIKLLWITSSEFITGISIEVFGRFVIKSELIPDVEGFAGTKYSLDKLLSCKLQLIVFCKKYMNICFKYSTITF
jgi:hypothetical protein